MPKIIRKLSQHPEYTTTPLTNVILSSNPCPTCVEAEGKTMTLAEWQRSKYGVPGSHRRICDGFCHCILVTAEMKETLETTGLGKRFKLRGDKDSDIGKIIDIGPREQKLSDLMDRYSKEVGRLPDEFYATPFAKKPEWLQNALKEGTQ